LYRAAYGNSQPFPILDADPRVPGLNLTLPSYAVFNQDRAQVVGGSGLAQSQLDLANAFVQRGEFARYPTSGPDFVAAVLATIKNDSALTSVRRVERFSISLIRAVGHGDVPAGG